MSREFGLDVLEVPGPVDLGTAVAECLLHTIVFVRAFGMVEPLDQEIAGLGLSFARVNDAALDADIKDKVRLFHELQMAGKSTGELVLSFFEKRLRSSGWFVATQQEENVCWEKWTVRLRFQGAAPGAGPRVMELSAKDKAVLADEVLRRVHFVLKFARTQQDHVPQMQQQSKQVLPFPYTIDVPSVAQSQSIWENLFKK